MASRDRLRQLLTSADLNGIDFVEVVGDAETTLRVHFLNRVDLSGAVTGASITGGEVVREVPVAKIAAADWSSDAEGRPLLTLRVPAPGDFSLYTLALESTALDDFYKRTEFTFKATCESDLDCAAPPSPCPPLSGDMPVIDYLAKDFASFKQALTEFSAARYPGWVERSEADLGVMLMEALAAVADELSYVQDRVAWEASLGTATQRRSIVRHARLIDYEPAPATSAGVVLQFDVERGPIPPGLVVTAQTADGSLIDFETGNGLRDSTNWTVSPAWNRGRLTPYWWDDAGQCLKAGAMEMWLLGHGFGFYPGQQLLIDTAPQLAGDPPIRDLVVLTPSAAGLDDHATEEFDRLFLDLAGNPTPVTRIRWDAAAAPRGDHDLLHTVVAGNLVPATQGRRYQESFAIPGAGIPPNVPVATCRMGVTRTAAVAGCAEDAQPVAADQFLHTLGGGRLAWLPGEGGTAAPAPEIALRQLPSGTSAQAVDWSWSRRLLDADALDPAFTIDPARFAAISTASGERTDEYFGDDGDTIRFGDGVFGLMPPAGAIFQVTYRVGAAAAGNVAADSIVRVQPGASLGAITATNPFPATGGTDAEPVETVQRMAPSSFRAEQFRAVRPEDYVAAAKSLPWVLNAGSTFRWTGSWFSVATTADPRAREGVPASQLAELGTLLDRYRLAGYESHVRPPQYVAVDLELTVCADPEAFRADVKSGILARLGTGTLPDGRPAFFNPDQFTFGSPLERSRLEAAVQEVAGVTGVLEVDYRRRGLDAAGASLPDRLAIGPDQIIRVDNDPSRPGMGSLKVYVEGGK